MLCLCILAAQEAVNDRISKAVVQLGDPDILLDLRKLNGNVRSSKFDDFWSEMQLYFDGLILPVDERRQSTVLHVPVTISIRELRDTISQRLVEKFPDKEKDIPSLEWIRYQFWPRNPYSSSALCHTGRFSIKFGVQIRQIRKDHIDAHHVNALLQYVKKLCPTT